MVSDSAAGRGLDSVEVRFDDHRALADAGLVLAATLANRHRDRHVHHPLDGREPGRIRGSRLRLTSSPSTATAFPCVGERLSRLTSLSRVSEGAAFFDLDRTLMAGSSGLPFARAAQRAGMISRRQMAGWGVQQVRFRLRGATEEASAAVLAEVREILRGVPEAVVKRMAPEALAAILPRIYPQMLDEVYSHQEAGRPTFLISAAGNGIVELLAQVLAMSDGIGTRYAVDAEGRFTGELDGPFMYGEGKVEAMRRYAIDHDISLAASWAYSDSVSDLPMLRAVGTPVAVNPDPELARVAGEEGWRVMTFERLGRRLTIAGATVTAAAVGGMGTMLASRRRRARRVRLALPGR
jgi:HAD superfamily hydrolase (TIGR01490 family)